jgi:UPF0716 family protein affecting phage T7 exclusion
MAPPVVAMLASPLGALVRAVARIRASVHVKLLAGFLLITGLFIAMTVVGLLLVRETARQTDLLDEATSASAGLGRSSTRSRCRCTSPRWRCWTRPTAR